MTTSYTSPADKKAEKATEDVITFIWLGSELNPEQIKNIQQWKKLNPSLAINIVVDEKFEQGIRQQLLKIDLANVVVKQRKNPEKLDSFIQKLVEPNDNLSPNYGAVSDILRFYLLKEMGGWYSDLDVTPVELQRIGVFNFCVNGATNPNDNKMLGKLTPDVIGSRRDHPLLLNAIAILEMICPLFLNEPESIQMLRSHDAQTKKDMTFHSTGMVLRLAMQTILFDGDPILNGQDISRPKMFNQFARQFESNFAESWVDSKKDIPENKTQDNSGKIKTIWEKIISVSKQLFKKPETNPSSKVTYSERNQLLLRLSNLFNQTKPVVNFQDKIRIPGKLFFKDKVISFKEYLISLADKPDKLKAIVKAMEDNNTKDLEKALKSHTNVKWLTVLRGETTGSKLYSKLSKK